MPWAQVVSFGFGLVALLLALWPRLEDKPGSAGQTVKRWSWPRLLKFPIFWLGVVFFAYVIAQALNPAWKLVLTPQVMYLAKQDYITWLPSGVDAPFERMNAWRMLCVWGGAWMLACALWTGLTRRAAVLRLLNFLVIGGTLLALVSILQKMTGTQEILWFIPSPSPMFHGTFVYKNHAAAHLNLICAAALALATWHHVRGLRHLERSTPAPVYFFAAIVCGVAVFMSGSRAAMLLLGGFVIVGALAYFIWRGRSRGVIGGDAATGIGGTAFVCLVALAAYFLNLGTSIDQIRLLLDQKGKGTIEFRVMAREATMELVQDKPLIGWGAGSFRHVFPFKQQNYPPIYRAHVRVMFWDHAHNDPVQALAELGILGLLAPALGLGWLLIRLLRAGALGQPAFLLLAIGLGLALAHGWVDFPLYNPAIFTTFTALWIILVRWADLERSR